MEFLSKYELRERITSGPIEVFLSQELRTGLSRLVHVLEWKENSEDLSSQEILELIRRWAPEPPGIILEAGRDPKIPYAYLVTLFPYTTLFRPSCRAGLGAGLRALGQGDSRQQFRESLASP